jgi:hypothetical protein
MVATRTRSMKTAETMVFAANRAEIHWEKTKTHAMASRLTVAAVDLDMVLSTSNSVGRFLLAESVLRNVPYSGGK